MEVGSGWARGSVGSGQVRGDGVGGLADVNQELKVLWGVGI